ncbi:hypothetical protein KIH86_02900 [Paenibacillus sp. HN-1]|uniref:hypothetical protein n=1 Tax=Paenibacillus TaxID=44249 RepID=UPI001CA9DCB9|nr:MULTISPECIES: hypothetical protein [Paenibacillus]MBY9080968.1 hypothetical protein [Paenibacillus sp. CGMCC 1.18879]MBY9083180.1 hypothetical protein [Paenibacillus sinensis]
MKNIMVRAWEIARTAVVRFGGKVQEYMAMALRQAWAEARKPVEMGLSLVRGIRRTDDAEVVTEAHGSWSKGWLARVTLATPGAKFDLDRKFIRASYDGRNRSGNGYLTYTGLADGIYEADSVIRSYSAHRIYFRIIAGVVAEIFEGKEDAKIALNGMLVAA